MEKKFVKCLLDQAQQLTTECRTGAMYDSKEKTADWNRRFKSLRSYVNTALVRREIVTHYELLCALVTIYYEA